MLSDFSPIDAPDVTGSLGLRISIPEIVLILWAFTFGIEEIRQVQISTHTTHHHINNEYRFKMV